MEIIKVTSSEQGDIILPKEIVKKMQSLIKKGQMSRISINSAFDIQLDIPQQHDNINDALDDIERHCTKIEELEMFFNNDHDILYKMIDLRTSLTRLMVILHSYKMTKNIIMNNIEISDEEELRSLQDFLANIHLHKEWTTPKGLKITRSYNIIKK